MPLRLTSKKSETNKANKHSSQLARGRPVSYLQRITKEQNLKPQQGGGECETFGLTDQHPKAASHTASFILDWIFTLMNTATMIPSIWI